MKIKKEYVALVIIIVGLSLYLLFRTSDRTRYELPKVPEIAEKDISKIEIAKPDTAIVLNRVDERWYLGPEGYLANPDRIENMLNIIDEFTVTALVSESKNYSRYGLDDDNKVTVKAWTADTLRREFEVGKVATSYQHTFVKLAGDDRVYHAQGNFRSQFDQTTDTLRDKTVLSFDQSAIREIQITKGEDVATVVRSEVQAETSMGQEGDAETVWQTADGKEKDNAQIDKMLNILSDLRCETYIDEAKKKDLSDPIYVLQLKGTQDHLLSIFAKREKHAKNYPAVSSGSDYPFLLPAWQVESLMKKPDESRPPKEKKQ